MIGQWVSSGPAGWHRDGLALILEALVAGSQPAEQQVGALLLLEDLGKHLMSPVLMSLNLFCSE